MSPRVLTASLSVAFAIAAVPAMTKEAAAAAGPSATSEVGGNAYAQGVTSGAQINGADVTVNAGLTQGTGWYHLPHHRQDGIRLYLHIAGRGFAFGRGPPQPEPCHQRNREWRARCGDLVPHQLSGNHAVLAVRQYRRARRDAASARSAEGVGAASTRNHASAGTDGGNVAAERRRSGELSGLAVGGSVDVAPDFGDCDRRPSVRDRGGDPGSRRLRHGQRRSGGVQRPRDGVRPEGPASPAVNELQLPVSHQFRGAAEQPLHSDGHHLLDRALDGRRCPGGGNLGEVPGDTTSTAVEVDEIQAINTASR